MSRFSFRFSAAVLASCCAIVCNGCSATPTVPSPAAVSATGNSLIAANTNVSALAAQPPFNLEAILRGAGFGHVEFRQDKDPTANIVNLGVWVRDLAPNTSYSLERAVDTARDGVCTGANWLTLGRGTVAQPIVTDDDGTGRADLWRDLSAFAPGSAFDIHFRVVVAGTTNVALQSGCYRFVVRD